MEGNEHNEEYANILYWLNHNTSIFLSLSLFSIHFISFSASKSDYFFPVYVCAMILCFNLRSIWNLIFFMYMFLSTIYAQCLTIAHFEMKINGNQLSEWRKKRSWNRFYWTFFIFGMNFFRYASTHHHIKKSVIISSLMVTFRYCIRFQLIFKRH